MQSHLDLDRGSVLAFAARLRAAADRARGGLRDLGPTLQADFHAAERQVFTTRGAAIGATWQPLSAVYSRRKRGGRLLVLTGELERSLTRSGSRYGFLRAGADFVEMGTRHPAAKFHQEGRGRLPRRQIIGVTQREEQRWAAHLSDFLFRGVTDGPP